MDRVAVDAVRSERPELERSAKDVAFEAVDAAHATYLAASDLLGRLDDGVVFDAVRAVERLAWQSWITNVELMMKVKR